MKTLSNGSLVNWLNNELNKTENNPEGIVFEITENVGDYPRPGGGKEPTDFTVTGTLIAGPSQYQPVQNILVINIPYSLQIYAYQGNEPDGLPSFNFEQTKQVVDNVFMAVNATIVDFGDVSAVITGATSYVGDVEVENGGYNRIPLEVTFVASVTSNGILSNSETIMLDGFELDVINFTVNKEKTGGSQTIIGSTTGKTINAQQVRVFTGSCYLTDYNNNENSAMKIFENELLDDISQNVVHTLSYRGRSYMVTLQQISEVLQAGSIIVISFAFAEFPTQYSNT